MPPTRNGEAWIVRPRPHHINRFSQFLTGGLIATGWPGIGDLSGRSAEEIRRALRRTYRQYTPRKLGHAVGQLDRLVNQIRRGDFVVVPDPDAGALYIGKVTGPYRFDQSRDNGAEGYPHHRPVRWLLGRTAVVREELPRTVQQSLLAHQPITVTNESAIRQFVAEAEALAKMGEARMSAGGQAGPEDNTVDEYDDFGGVEGDITYLLRLHRKRDRQLRLAKIRQAIKTNRGILRCEVPRCGFDFAATYGRLGIGYAQVHHLRPLSSLYEASEVKLKGLMIVCANCHVMIHRGGQCRPVRELIRRR
jgi:hypothetical protein